MKRRAKDPDKYSRNRELAGFTDDHGDAELRVADGDQYNDGAITKRNRAYDGLLTQDHFEHMELYGGGPGTSKNGALIFIPPDPREWLDRDLYTCNHDSTTPSGAKGVCSLCAVRCQVIEVSGVFVKEQPLFVGDTIYAKIQVSRHVSYHVS